MLNFGGSEKLGVLFFGFESAIQVHVTAYLQIPHYRKQRRSAFSTCAAGPLKYSTFLSYGMQPAAPF
jgi:hypothetical protein